MLELLDFSNTIPDIRRVAIIVGHTHYQHGATTSTGVSEYDFCLAVARHIKARFPADNGIRIFTKDHIGTEGVACQVAAWKADLSIELHFNAFDGTVEGAEILVLKEEQKDSSIVAAGLLHSWCEDSGKRNRGVKYVIGNDRGAKNLHVIRERGVKYVMLFEPFFGDNPKDVVTPKKLADSICKFLLQTRSPLQ